MFKWFKKKVKEFKEPIVYKTKIEKVTEINLSKTPTVYWYAIYGPSNKPISKWEDITIYLGLDINRTWRNRCNTKKEAKRRIDNFLHKLSNKSDTIITYEDYP